MLLELLVIIFSFTSYILLFDKSKSWYRRFSAELFSWLAELDVFFHNIKEIRMEIVEMKNLLKNSQLMNSSESTEVVFESDVELVDNQEQRPKWIDNEVQNEEEQPKLVEVNA